MTFKNFSFKAGLMILFLTALSYLVRSWRWKTILKSQGYDISAMRIIEYYLSGNALGFFFPLVVFGGEVFRGYDLKEKYSVPWSKSIASVFIDRFLEITINTIAIIFGVFFFLSKVSFPSENFKIYLFVLAIFTALLIGAFYFKSFKKESIIGFFLKRLNLRNYNGANTIIDTEREIFSYFRPNAKTMWHGLALTILMELILLARAFLLVLFLGKNIGSLASLSIVAFSFLAVILPIPAAIGSHEAVQSFIFNSLGLGASTGLAFVFIIRGAELIMALAGLIIFFRLGLELLRAFLLRKIKKLFHG